MGLVGKVTLAPSGSSHQRTSGHLVFRRALGPRPPGTLARPLWWSSLKWPSHAQFANQSGAVVGCCAMRTSVYGAILRLGAGRTTLRGAGCVCGSGNESTEGQESSVHTRSALHLSTAVFWYPVVHLGVINYLPIDPQSSSCMHVRRLKRKQEERPHSIAFATSCTRLWLTRPRSPSTKSPPQFLVAQLARNIP